MRLPLATASIPGTESGRLPPRRRAHRLLVRGHHRQRDRRRRADRDGAGAGRAARSICAAGFGSAGGRGTRPGATPGRTWYADTHFRELRDHAVGYLNIDSPGVRESTIWDCRYNTGEIEPITAAVVVGALRADAEHPAAAAGRRSVVPRGRACRVSARSGCCRSIIRTGRRSAAAAAPTGGTRRRIPSTRPTPAILAEDTRIYVTMTARMCAPEVIPYDFTPAAQDFIDHLTPLPGARRRPPRSSETIAAAEAVQGGGTRFWPQRPPTDVRTLNDGLKRLARIVNSALYTIDGPYEMDPALQLPVLPGLAPIRELAALDPASDEFQFLLTRLRRQKNRMTDALLAASELAEGL